VWHDLDVPTRRPVFASILLVGLIACDVEDTRFSGGDAGATDANRDASVQACEGATTCVDPPPSACADAMTRRDYAGPGTCPAGVCEYPYQDVPCEHGCRDGACVAPLLDQLEPGFSTTCALLRTGAVKCWGAGGQVGDGTTEPRTSPVGVLGLDAGVTSIAVGSNHTCATTTGGTVRCWGSNFFGQLGNGTRVDEPAPVTTTGVGPASRVFAGNQYGCALGTMGGIVSCWGNNAGGQIGNGLQSNIEPPTVVAGLGPVVTLATGYDFVCAVVSGGAVQCWGNNTQGQLGGGGPLVVASPPVEVAGLDLAVGLAAGNTHACAITSLGGVLCWGDNTMGQLGNGSGMSSSIPVPVAGFGATVLAISAGAYHTCALTDLSEVFCWGLGESGALGQGTLASSPTPTRVLASGFGRLAAGGRTTCSVTPTGGARCWGLLHGNGADSSTPVEVLGL
jgi:alpha-tubulin suppressor-like RCC1 family protein